MKIIEELIYPYTMDHFAEHYLYRAPYAAPFKAAVFRDVLSWSLLEEIFSTGHQDCWLPRRGCLPLEEELSNGTLTADQARKGFSEGRTILVRHAERAHPLVAVLAKNFEDIFHCPVDVQLYCTPEGEEGFDWHYDLEEVFVLQSIGEKEFRLKPNTSTPRPLVSPLPKNLHFERELTKTEIRCHLKAGDWLYIPSGYWHKAKAVTSSFHLSVGVLSGPRVVNEGLL